MANLDYEARRLETAKIVRTAISKSFGHISPLSDLYMKVSKLSIIINEELEKETLVWESRIRKDYEKNPRFRKVHSDGSILTDVRGVEK